MIENVYLMPDYYDTFKCKGGDCRCSCCTGWNIEISLDEYLRLIGVDCSPELRKRLDCAFYIAKQPLPDSYAYIKPNVFGDCHLRDEDGLCALHKELGEGALPAICRYYPRSFQPKHAYECSCSNSCEEVVEYLLLRREKIKFVSGVKCFDAPAAPLVQGKGLARFYTEIRSKCIEILQNRNATMTERMIVLGKFIEGLTEDAEKIAQFDATAVPIADVEEDREGALAVQIELAEVFEAFSPTIAECNRDVVKNLKLDGDIKKSVRLYRSALKHLESIVEGSEIGLENLMINHLFYSRFPFSEDGESVWEDYVSFCASYLFLRYFVAGFMADEVTLDAFTDMVAKVFRFIEHSRFDRNADIILNREHLSDAASVTKLLLSVC